MRFQVPQFTGVEDKIFGPFTFKQFIFLVGGGGLAYIIWTFLGWWGIILIIPTVGVSLALAFYKVHGRPFISVMESAFKYYLGNRLYTWRKEAPKPKSAEEIEEKKPVQQVYVPKLSESKLKDLTWSLDIKESLNPLTRDDEVRHGHKLSENM